MDLAQFGYKRHCVLEHTQFDFVSVMVLRRGHVLEETHFLFPHQDETFMSTTPGGVKQRGSKFNHKLIATELGFCGRLGLSNELCVDA